MATNRFYVIEDTGARMLYLCCVGCWENQELVNSITHCRPDCEDGRNGWPFQEANQLASKLADWKTRGHRSLGFDCPHAKHQLSERIL